MYMRCPNCRDKFEVTRDMYDHHMQCVKCNTTFNVPFPQAEIAPEKTDTPRVEVANMWQAQQQQPTSPDGQKVNVIDMEIGWINMLNICFRFIICFFVASVLIFGLIGALVMLIISNR